MEVLKLPRSPCGSYPGVWQKLSTCLQTRGVSLNTLAFGVYFGFTKAPCVCPRKKAGTGYQRGCSSRKTWEIGNIMVKNRNQEC